MKTILNPVILLLAALLAGTASMAAKSAEYTREIKKEFSVNPDAKLILENKFGDIRILPTDQNRVTIQVMITVDARDLESAVKLFEKVKIRFANTADQVEARTELDEDLRVRGKFSIDYTVSMPVSMSLDAENKFGDLTAGEIGGKSRLKIGYGNLEISKLSNSDNLVEVRFGKARIDRTKGAVMILKYSEFNGDYAGSLNLNSQYSNVSIDDIVVLDATFEGGNLDLGTASVLTCRSKFSDISLGTLDQKLDLNNQYGSFEIEEVKPGFTALTVVNSYGNIELGMAPDASFKLEADMHFCNLGFDKDKASMDYYNESSHDLQARGTIGSGASALVKITSSFGNVDLNN